MSNVALGYDPNHGREIAPLRVKAVVGGVVIEADAWRDGNTAFLRIAAETPLGPIGGVIHTDVETAHRMIEAAERHEIIPRISAAVENFTGHRPLLTR